MSRPGLRHAAAVVALGALLAISRAQAPPAGEPASGTPPQPATADGPLTALPYTPSLHLASMDPRVAPCVDFYRHACGGWIKANPIPPDQPGFSVYGKLQKENERFLFGLLLDAARPRPERDASRQVGDYFAACMDEDAVERAGLAPLRPLLDAIAALRSPAELPALIAREHLSLGNGVAFGLDAAQDLDDSERMIAFVSAGGLGLPDRDYYVKTDPRSIEIRARYQAHVARMLGLTGESAPAAARDARAIVALETALARASLTRVERRDPKKLRHPMSPTELAALMPHFAIAPYLAAVGLADIERLNVTEPAFFRELDRQIARRPPSVWKAYLRWHATDARAEYLRRALASADFDFFGRYLRGVREQAPRWRRCVRWVDHDLGEALGRIFVERTFEAHTRERTLAMVRGVERAMEDDLAALPWMGPTTRRRALEKLKTMVNKIGYPDRWRDYSALAIARTDFAANVEAAARFETRRQLARIGLPPDRSEWHMTPPTVNAYYDPQMNDMNFPAGVLQPPLFDPRLDDAPNYGNTGGTIGHELIHAFDDEGRHFDARGNLRDWWTPADAAEFERRAACLVAQYAAYPVIDEIKVNSRLTLGEDVADLGGVRLAYQAWKQATAGQALTPIDGLTPDQRFFIGMAQWACADERPESKRLNALTNPHSPQEWRVNGVVANLPEFAAAFQCQPGQPMVRETPCRVW